HSVFELPDLGKLVLRQPLRTAQLLHSRNVDLGKSARQARVDRYTVESVLAVYVSSESRLDVVGSNTNKRKVAVIHQVRLEHMNPSHGNIRSAIQVLARS